MEQILDLNQAVPLRLDIPTATDEDQLSNLEKINQTIPGFVDSLTGPIIEISEGTLPQIPLSSLYCKILCHSKSGIFAKKIKCFGVSAREVRNQVALYALENFFSSFKNFDSKKLNFINNSLTQILETGAVSFGVGWSSDEALYRCLCNFYYYSYTHINKYIKESYLYELNKLTEKQSIGRYLLDCYLDISDVQPVIYWTRIDNTLFLAYSSSLANFDSNNDLSKINYSIGLTLEHAVLNLLLKLLIAKSEGKQNGTAKIKIHPCLLWAGMQEHFSKKIIKTLLNKFEIHRLKFNFSLKKMFHDNFFVFIIREK